MKGIIQSRYSSKANLRGVAVPRKHTGTEAIDNTLILTRFSCDLGQYHMGKQRRISDTSISFCFEPGGGATGVIDNAAAGWLAVLLYQLSSTVHSLPELYIQYVLYCTVQYCTVQYVRTACTVRLYSTKRITLRYSLGSTLCTSTVRGYYTVLYCSY